MGSLLTRQRAGVCGSLGATTSAGRCALVSFAGARASTSCLACNTTFWNLQVPWGGRQLTVGLLAWASTFVAVGLIVMPLIARGVGVQARPLTCA